MTHVYVLIIVKNRLVLVVRPSYKKFGQTFFLYGGGNVVNRSLGITCCLLPLPGRTRCLVSREGAINFNR